MVALALPFPTPSEPSLRPLRPHRILLSQTAFVDHQRAWVRGGDALFEALRNTATWRTQRRTMYDRIVDVPRLLGRLEADVPPVLRAVRDHLDTHYAVHLDRLCLARYRDGNDSVAWHGDRLGDNTSWSVVAIVSLGGPRRFLLRRTTGGRSVRIDLGNGDLLVLGGDIQKTWQHCVPKLPLAAPRISVMFRHSAPWTASRGVSDLQRSEYCR